MCISIKDRRVRIWLEICSAVCEIASVSVDSWSRDVTDDPDLSLFFAWEESRRRIPLGVVSDHTRQKQSRRRLNVPITHSRLGAEFHLPQVRFEPGNVDEGEYGAPQLRRLALWRSFGNMAENLAE